MTIDENRHITQQTPIKIKNQQHSVQPISQPLQYLPPTNEMQRTPIMCTSQQHRNTYAPNPQIGSASQQTTTQQPLYYTQQSQATCTPHKTAYVTTYPPCESPRYVQTTLPYVVEPTSIKFKLYNKQPNKMERQYSSPLTQLTNQEEDFITISSKRKRNSPQQNQTNKQEILQNNNWLNPISTSNTYDLLNNINDDENIIKTTN